MGEVTYRSAEQDFVDTNRGWFKANLFSAHRRWHLLRVPTILAILATLGVSCIEIGHDLVGTPLIAGAAGGFVAWLMCLGLSYALIPRRTRRIFLQQRNLDGDFTYGWTHEGLHHRSPDAAGVIKWEHIHRWHESSTTFHFFVSDAMCHFIPRRVLSDDQAAELRGMAEQYGLRRY